MPRPDAATDGWEFRGVVQENEFCLVNLYNPATKISHWIPVGGSAFGLTVQDYDRATGRVLVTRADRSFTLWLRPARTLLAGDNVPLKLLPPAERVTEGEAPGMPEFMRRLPLEARRVLEEVRRRRTPRWPEAPRPQTGPVAESR